MIIETKHDMIKLTGALTENQWFAIKSSIVLLLAANPRGVIIDASDITEVNEAGAHTLFEASSFVQEKNARLVVAGMPENLLQEVKNIPGVRSQLVTAATVEEAKASLEATGDGLARDDKAKPFILVPLTHAWRHALEYAAVEAYARRAEIHLLYVLQIPRNRPLGVPIPEMEQEALRTLADAEVLLKRKKISARKLTTRTRDLMDGITKFAADAKPILLVLAFTKDDLQKEGNRLIPLSLFCEVSCDVAIYCVQS